MAWCLAADCRSSAKGVEGILSADLTVCGQRFRDNDSAESVFADCHVFTGGLTLGMEAEMIYGGKEETFVHNHRYNQ